MKKKITLRLDPWTQLALWLIVLLLVADRLKSLPLTTTAYAQSANNSTVIDINLVQIGGSKVNSDSGIPVRQVGAPPTSRVGPANFPFQKTQE